MKKVIGIALALVLVLTLIGGAVAEEKGKIGVLLPSLSFDFQAQMAAGVKRAAEEFGYGYQEVDYNFDAELQLSGVETLAVSGVKGYYGIFVNAESANAMFEKYPDIGVISQAMDVKANGFIVNDYQKLGEQFVETVDNFRKEKGIQGGQMAAVWLHACEVVGSDFNNAMVTMKKTMEDYCTAQGIEYVSDQFADNDEEASNIAEQLFNAHPDLRYLFCLNNGFAIVAANEITSAAPDVSEYLIFSSEGDPESFRLIASGTSPYRACAYNDIEQSGYDTGLQLINWVENGKLENVVVTRELVDSRNVQDFIKE